MDGRTWCQTINSVWSKSRVTKRFTDREVGKMTHQPTVTKNNKNTQSKFDSSLGSCNVFVAPRSGRLSSSSSTQLLLLPKGNSEVPCFFVFFKLPPPTYASLHKIATRQHCGVFSGQPQSLRHQRGPVDDCSSGRGKWRRTAERGVGRFMAKWIAQYTRT